MKIRASWLRLLSGIKRRTSKAKFYPNLERLEARDSRR